MSSWLERDPRWAGLREDRLQVGATSARVLVADGPDGAAGVPQLLVHGVGASATTWVDVIGPLATAGPVVAIDLPGFGGTPAPGSGHGQLVDGDFVLAAMDALGWDSAVVHASSTGAMVAVLAAASSPRVKGLVLTSAALPPTRPDGQLPLPWPSSIGALPLALPVVGSANAEHALGRDDGRQIHPGEMLALLFPDPSVLRPTVLQALAVDAALPGLRPGRDRFASIVAATAPLTRMWLDPRRAHEAIDAIVAPTLLISGERDPLLPVAVALALGRRHPAWTTWIAPDAGHLLMLERPDRYVESVTVWWSRVLQEPQTSPAAS